MLHSKTNYSERLRWLVIGPFLVVVVLLAGLTVTAVDTLSAVRAYVGGESLWSKSQKDAVSHIGRYVVSRDTVDYQLFLKALTVPWGDRRARVALDSNPPDLAAARQGLLDGGNHVDDVDGMIRLYLRFRRLDFMSAAINDWAEADIQLAELAALAEQVHQRIASGDTTSPELRTLLARLPDTNQRLTALGQRFSAALGQASRAARQLVLVGTLTLAAALCVGGLLLTGYVLKQQARNEAALEQSRARDAQAQLDKQAAEALYLARTEFLSRMSHELRTPLNAVLGFAELMQSDPVDVLTSEQQQRIQYVLDSGRHLLRLIDEILDLASLKRKEGQRELEL